MKVAFTDICKTGNHYSVTDDSWFPGRELRRSQPVQATIDLCRQGDARVEVQGALQTGVTLVCDRCLADYGFVVDVAFHLLLEVPADRNWQVRELECSGSDLDTVQLLEPVVDLREILRQQLFLSLPEKFLCSGRCKGLCPTCGADLNRGGCSCEQQTAVSPFAVLAGLKGK
jgi:uncharacterized protein